MVSKRILQVHRKKNTVKALSALLALALFFSQMAVPGHAVGTDISDAVHNDDSAYIAEKSAQWIDTENYLAELTLAVNGTEVREPLDVIIALDRSGSMDMDFIHHTYGDHSSSCPCLNQEHFYLKPVDFVPEDDTVEAYRTADGTPYTAQELYTDFTGSPGTETIFYGPGEDEITVYNPELVRDDGVYGKWVILKTEKIHLYYEFPVHNTSNPPVSGGIGARNGIYMDSYELAPYHFAMSDDNEYVRISRWDTQDTRIPGISAASVPKGETGKPYSGNVGLWDHADATQACYDRWTEAKDAIQVFSGHLLNEHEGNRVALIPFSLRDGGMLNVDQTKDNVNIGFLNNVGFTKYFTQWLIEEGYISALGTLNVGISLKGNTYLTGTFDTKVPLTDNLADITDMLPKLFTTVNTDYIYGLSMAYNMIADRPEEESDRAAVVVFLSDGTPQLATGTYGNSNNIYSFFNPDQFISWLSGAIKSDGAFIGETIFDNDGDVIAFGDPIQHFWPKHIVSAYRRHDVNPKHLIDDGNGGAMGLGASIVTVGYMIESTEVNRQRLTNMASDPSLYIEIAEDSETATTAGELGRALLDTSLFPGGRNSVLTDVVSKYFYVPDDWEDNIVYSDNAQNTKVRIEPATGPDVEPGTQKIIWEIGDIFHYATGSEPRITIPLVLREEYRSVTSTTYYPTNADTPEPPLDVPGGHDPDADHGGKLTYTDPEDVDSYDTIETPKLPVGPKSIEVPLPGVEKFLSYVTAPSSDAIFTFVLTGKGEVPMPEHARISVTGAGSADFGSVEITEEGVYEYSIHEEKDGLSGYTYDKSVYNVTITVTGEEGVLRASTVIQKAGDETWSGENAAFTNSYKVEKPPEEPDDPPPKEPPEKPEEPPEEPDNPPEEPPEEPENPPEEPPEVPENPPEEPPEEPIEPPLEPPVELPTEPGIDLYINKVLVDEEGNPIGSGIRFSVQVLDSAGNVVETVKVVANGDATIVRGLESGEVYAAREMVGEYYTLTSFSIGLGQTIEQDYIIFRSTLSSASVRGSIQITLTNVSSPDEVELIDEDPPLAVWPEIGDGEVIDIMPDEVPLGNLPQTGTMEENSATVRMGILLAFTAAAAGLFLLRRKEEAF